MQNLFSEFKRTTAADWKARLNKDLKGEALESLTWKNENGFDVQPFYTSEDLHTHYEPAFTHTDWEIGVNGKFTDAKQLNAQLLRDLSAGASSVSINCNDLDLEVALNGVQLNYIHAVFYVNEINYSTLRSFLEKNYKLSELHCCIVPETLRTFSAFNDWLEQSADYSGYKNIKTNVADLFYTHNQDGLAYYEVAMTLSFLNEYLTAAAENKLTGDAPFVVKMGVSTDYFIQIAKLRAIRRLWNVLKAEYGIPNDLYLLAETSLTNKSISDSYNNLLRTTLEAMAAVLGGCNELVVNEFDIFFEVNHSLSERLAINQQLILKEESYLDKMADVACGSYYIESITDAIAEKALTEFKRFEKEGGYFRCLDKNIFINDISKQAHQRKIEVDTKARSIIGVNKFRNEKDTTHPTILELFELRKFYINNPVLVFEIENFFRKKDA